MTSVELDMIQTAGIGSLALLVGMFLTKKLDFLRRFCVPSPVSGGIIFSLLSLMLYGWFHIEMSFDGALKDVFMLAFFTCVGFQSDLKVLKQGGKLLLIMLALLVVIIALQNLLPLGIARLLGIDPLVGLAAGSASMTGGHGTAAGFAGIFEEMGLQGAATIGMAAATFGLVAGSLIGGPLAERLVRTKLTREEVFSQEEEGAKSDDTLSANRSSQVPANTQGLQQYAKAIYSILLVMGGGTLISWLLAKTGVTFPTYFGSLILAAIARNVIGFVKYKEDGKWVKAEQLLDIEHIIGVGNFCLYMFLGMAMVSLKLWELQSLALPLVVILVCQAVIMALFAYFAAFPLLGRNYDAAVLCAGMCGFGLGATPNAMANMSAVCYKYRHTVKPFLIVPIIGAMFADLINTGMITFFLNILK